MDLEKLKQWMEMAQKYQNGNFWESIFDQYNNTTEQTHPGNKMPSQPSKASKRFPLVDIYLTDTQIMVIVELPGLQKEEVQLSISGNKLLVKGVSKQPFVSGSPYLTERQYGEFERLIELPEPADHKDIQAKFEGGLLFVTYKRRYTRHENIPIL
ncbi:Hsp20/alpha crystallin family protein [Siminovitchia fortis]|uniref:Hsp20/alpha crystallin family protein n=1 Tax=Siminovitchia fortis TaxID=254758 RepID=A0A443J414_9BACI|nr:Hsp20/alpha crystallin family protein [Siminovitchia fortis]RWR15214.1 Hsp20/alpha crystallin family protein [Siminovitchia fortis]WHY82645.1 Hsp20/alpha crystallin family protein [Siminovitchia fortis]